MADKRNIAGVFTSLEPNDFRVLNAVERGMRENEWVPKNELSGLARLPEEEVEYRINRLNDFEMIERRTIQYEGYSLEFKGYDALAVNAFVKRDTVLEMGTKVDEGKESEIYRCRNDESDLVVKLHREGYTNFREVDRVRDYTSDKNHVSWLYTARKAAEREYDALTSLYPEVSVPEPVDHNRHAIVMDLFEGIELGRARIDRSEVVLDVILREISESWDKGYVHADMSEYNVLIAEDDVKLIDWPQNVKTDHPHAHQLLERDLSNILSYFNRKYPKSSDDYPDIDEAINRVREMD